jgi:hypothetical protein
MNRLLRLLVIGGGLCFGVRATHAAETIEVGAPFPELVLPTLAGEPQSITNFRGSKVILHVFASW